MMRSWEEKLKFAFGKSGYAQHGYEVEVPGVHDNEEANVEDGYHTIKR
jgi:hypothetical protein